MSSDTIPPSPNTPRTSTTGVESDGPDSATDSLNSLIGGDTIDKDCGDACMEVQCSLANQCAMSCEDGDSKMERRKSVCCNTVGQCVWGVLLLIMSVSGFIFTPLDVMLKEKLNMRPGFPPYEWWADPPDEVKLRVYVFNVTNHERFMKGLDEKLDVQEIGPIVYLEKLLHSNMRFNDNNTLTYTAKRYPIYLPLENSVDLNATLFVPNMAVLGLSSYLYDANYLVRTAFRILVNSHGSGFFVQKTVYEYLWDYREPVLDTSKNIVPGLVPVNNMGMLARIYANFTDEVTVTIGPQWGHKRFFQIDKFEGQPQLPGYNADVCPDRIVGSTEGVMYHQRLSKQDVLLYWRKTVCKLMPLYFDSEITVDSVPVYRYNLSEVVYERVTNGTDCYDTNPSLPAGLSDGSKCYFDFPMVISYPHFYTGAPAKDRYVTGLRPDRYKHNSYTIVEPIMNWCLGMVVIRTVEEGTNFISVRKQMTGIPFRSVARMQSNLRVRDLSGFSREYDRFSNLVIPLFWAEYNQEGLPSHIRWTIYFMTVVLPPLSNVMLSCSLLLGCYFIFKQIYIHHIRNDSLNSMLQFKSKNVALAKNKIFVYEKEAFIKVPS